MNKDIATTLAGGSAGLLLLNSVKWELIPQGELVKVLVALALIVFGAVLYSRKAPDEPAK